MPPVLAWMLGAIGAVLVAKVITREWRRVNEELHRREAEPQPAPARDAEHDRMPRLRRDPATGVYRPNR